METLLVQQYNCYVNDGYGYNATLGGNNSPKTEEHKEKMRKPHNMTLEGSKKISLAHKGKPSPKRGIPLSDNQKLKLSETQKEQYKNGDRVIWNKGLIGVIVDSEETKQKKKSAANKPENIKANSDRRKKFWEENPDFAPARGEDHFKALLTKEQVIEIRSKYIPIKYSCAKLGKEYGVSQSTIYDIVNFRSWKNT